MIPEDKLSTIKLQPLQLATITSLPSPINDHLPPAAKTPRLSQSLSSTPPQQSKLDTPPISIANTSTIETSTKPITTPQPSAQTRQQQINEPTPVFPMALLAAFNLQQQHSGILPNPQPPHPMPTFPPLPICMKRFNPAAFCLCVGCLMQNGNMNAGLVGRSMRPNSDNR